MGGWITGGARGALLGGLAGAAVGSIAAPASWQAGAAVGAGSSILGQCLGISVTCPAPELWRLRNYDPFSIVGAAVGSGAAVSVGLRVVPVVEQTALNSSRSLAGFDYARRLGALSRAFIEGAFSGAGERAGRWLGQDLTAAR